MDVLEQVAGLARKVAESKGLDLVDTELFRAGRRRIVRVYIGKPGGVGVEDCARVSQELGVLLDAENVLEDDPYTLEVSSPGLDRPFKTLRDYERNVGHWVRMSLREPLEGKNQLVGRLEGADAGGIRVEVDGDRKIVPLASIALAKVEVRF